MSSYARGRSTAWEQRQLGEVGLTYPGLSGKTKEDFGHGDARFVTYMNVYSNAVANPDGVEAIEKDDRQHEVMNGDVFFTGSSETPDEVGLSSVWLGNSTDTYLNSFCFGYRPSKQLDSLFLASSLRSPQMRSRIILLAQGISRFNISKTQVMQLPLCFPSLPEQRRIGEFFTTLDNLIAAAERQEDLLRQKKQAYLQLMFPQEGKTEPRLRFAGFTGEWQQKTVGDLVGKTFGGGTPSTSNSEYWIGRLPWIQSSNLADGQIFRVDVEKHISDIALQHSSAQLIPADSIAVVTHVGVGKLALVPFEYSTSQDFISLGDLKCDSRFLSLALQERLRKDLRVVQGSTIKGITKQDLLHKKLTLPKQRDEQARIATFLMVFGKTIAQINERKALLQRMKEAYLQRLFL